MVHPTFAELLAGGAAAHVAACDSCRRLAQLAGVDVPASPAREPLPTVDASVFSDWAPFAEGRGGMGQLFQARDRRLGRLVVIKQLRPGLSASEREVMVERFEHEARLTARLQHPAIVGVYEAGRFDDGEPFYVMPLVRGAPLSVEIEHRATLTERIALLPHLMTVAEGVAYAHDQGVVHRDIKPDNILVGTFGETVLIDWGLAKELTRDDAAPPRAPSTPSGALTVLGVGTPHYMPPEQARGEAPHPSFDVYALGATLYHTLAGRPPYGATGGTEARRALATDHPEPLASIVPEAPPELVDIVERAMARDPSERFASARALADELRRHQAGQLLTSRRYTWRELVRHFARQHHVALRVAAAALVLLIALAVVAYVRITRERDRAEESQRFAERELRRARGTIASARARIPAERLDAIELGLGAITPEAVRGEAPVPEVLQGLVDAVTAGPPLVPLIHTGTVKDVARAGDWWLAVDDARALVVWDARTGAVVARAPTTSSMREWVDTSPDGRRAIVCGYTPGADVIELPSGRTRTSTTNGTVVGCRVTPKGDLLTVASDVELRRFDTLARTERFDLPGAASAMTMAPSGHVAVSTLAGAVWLWRPGAPPRLGALPPSLHLTFSADEATLYAAGRDRVLRAVDVETLATRVVRPASKSQLGVVSPSPDGRTIAAGIYDTDRSRRSFFFDPQGLRTPHERDGITVAWAGPSRLFVEHYGPVSLVDRTTGGTLLTLDAHVEEVVFGLDGTRAVTASRDGLAFLWDLTPGRSTGLVLGPTRELEALEARAGRVLAVSSDGTAHIFDVAADREVFAWDAGVELSAGRWLSEEAIVLGDLAGRVHVVEAHTGAIRASATTSGPVSALAAAPNGDVLAIGTFDGALELARPTLERRTLAPPAAHGAVTALAFSHDGARLASAHADGTTRLFDVATGRALARSSTIGPAADDVGEGHTALAFFEDGQELVAARPAAETWVLDAKTLATHTRWEGRVVAHRGHRFAALSLDGALVVHDARGAPPITLRGPRATIVSAGFSDDGTRVATGDTGGVVRVWDVASAHTTLTFASPGLGAATSLAFVDDRLFVGYASGALRMAPTSAATAIERACRALDHFGRAAPHAGVCGARR